MFDAKVFSISVVSSGIPLEEERLARDLIVQWNEDNGHEKKVVFLPLTSAIPDIYVFIIDNYADTNRIKDAIATGAKVILFFCKYHDPKNTIMGEVDSLNLFRKQVQGYCICIDYCDTNDFKIRFLSLIKMYENDTYIRSV